MNRALLTIVAIACSTIFTVAQDTLTLSQAIKIGLEKNFSIRLARNSYSIAKNNNTLGNAGMLPWVEANGGWRLSSDETEQTFKSVGTTTDKRDVNNLNGNVPLGGRCSMAFPCSFQRRCLETYRQWASRVCKWQ